MHIPHDKGDEHSGVAIPFRIRCRTTLYPFNFHRIPMRTWKRGIPIPHANFRHSELGLGQK